MLGKYVTNKNKREAKKERVMEGKRKKCVDDSKRKMEEEEKKWLQGQLWLGSSWHWDKFDVKKKTPLSFGKVLSWGKLNFGQMCCFKFLEPIQGPCQVSRFVYCLLYYLEMLRNWTRPQFTQKKTSQNIVMAKWLMPAF